jgi:hypothetical protein
VRERARAIRRGYQFLYDFASDAEVFGDYATEFLWCFALSAYTSREESVITPALKMGRELVRRWQSLPTSEPSDDGVLNVLDPLYGGYAAARLGIQTPALKRKLRALAPRFSAQDYLWFDPAVEVPPTDAPGCCGCGAYNDRGAGICSECGEATKFMAPQEVWFVALSHLYTAHRYGANLGASYEDLIKWLPAFRMRMANDLSDEDFYDTVYAITHVVYTLNDYGVYLLSPELLPDEYNFLTANLTRGLRFEDPDMIGEFMDSLRAFGMTEADQPLQTGIDFLLSHQNDDGSWGDPTKCDSFDRLHSTWTALDGLRDYAWRGRRICFPNLRPLLLSWRPQS